MTIQLTLEQEMLVEESIRSGHLRSIDDLLAPALQELRRHRRQTSAPTESFAQFLRRSPLFGSGIALEREQERDATFLEVKEKLELGARQAERGELLDGDEVFEELEASILERRQKAWTSAAGPVNDRRDEMRWLAEESGPYAGEWVALEGRRLIAHGVKLADVSAAAAKVAGSTEPLFASVAPKDADVVPFVGS